MHATESRPQAPSAGPGSVVEPCEPRFLRAPAPLVSQRIQVVPDHDQGGGVVVELLAFDTSAEGGATGHDFDERQREGWRHWDVNGMIVGVRVLG